MVATAWRFALICGLALAGQGCGSDPGGGNAAAPGAPDNGSASVASQDACALVTKEEVAEVIGEAVVEAKSDGGTCSYETEDPASALRIEVARTGGAGEMQTARDAAGVLGRMGGKMAEGKGAEAQAGEAMAEGGPVTGLGDQAFFGTNRQLHVLKGDTYFAVSPPIMRSRMGGGSPLLTGDQRQAMARAIAEKALARL